MGDWGPFPEEGKSIVRPEPEEGNPSPAAEERAELRLVTGDEAPAVANDATAPTVESALTDSILGLDDPEPDEELPAGTTPETAQVRRFARALAKAVKAIRIYPLQNPMCRRFADEATARMMETFQLMDAVRLTVGKTKFFFAGDPVLEQAGRDESVPGRLFWDGIREITFHVGLTPQETLDFLSLFRKNAQKVVDGEDDFVTLMWEGRFEHITTIAIDDLLDLENADDPIPEEFGKEFMNYVDLEMHNLEDDEETDRLAKEIAEEIRAKLRSENDPVLFGVSPKERERLLEEIADEDSPRMLGDIVRLIGETLHLEKDEASFVELVHVLAGALLGLIGEGRLHEATGVVRLLRLVRDDRTELTPAMTACVDSSLRAAWDDTRRTALIRHLDSGRAVFLASLVEFVRALPPAAVGSLCELLGELESARARRHLIDALIEKAEGNVTPFLPFLRDPRWYLVRNVALILGAMKNEQSVGPLKELLRHPDYRVRREALSALSEVGRGRALDVLAEALHDSDPRIRMGAARNLALAGRRALPHFLTVLEDKDFDKRELSEKRTFYEAVGYAGGKEVLPIMRDVLNRRSLFRRVPAEELRACACEALGWIGGSEAKDLLTAQLGERSVIVRTAAQSGLRRIAKGRENESIVKEAA